MPSVFALITNPELSRADPKPVPVDLVKMILTGLAVWVVALVVTWLRYRSGDALVQPVWTCVAGVSGGVLALIWAKVARPQLGG